MPFVIFDELDGELVTPKHSTAYGELVTGEQIEVGRLRFKKGEGAEPHQHPHEQILIVTEGLLRVTLDGESQDMGPGGGFHAPPDTLHAVEALEDTVVISSKGIVRGVGHKI